MKLNVIDAGKKSTSPSDVAVACFDIEPNSPVVHQIIKAELAGSRAGSASTKRRDEVRGGGKKPFKQKGTGRARAGSIRSPLWRGGGSVFGPKPRSYAQKMPKKMVNLAVRSIIASKAADGKLYVIDNFVSDKPKTKFAVEVLSSLGISGKNTVVTMTEEYVIRRSFNNLNRTLSIEYNDLSAYVLLDNDNLIFSKSAFDALKERLA